MDFKRALWVGIVTYIVSFLIGMGVILAMGFQPSQITEIPSIVLYINIAITIVLAVVFTLLYFRGKGIAPGVKEGFFFGIVLVIIGFILDAIIFSASSQITGTQQNIIMYYSNPIFWTALLLFLATAAIVGAVKGRVLNQ